ncbi:MAG: sigma-54 dependent transcriptional regulator [Verrucomicrobiota bacterium]
MRDLRSPPHVLLVEDDASLGDALSSILASEGYRVSCSSRGDEGCRMALADLPDLVVTDLRLPGMGGIDLVRSIRHAQPSIPIILMTAHGSPESVIEATKEGALDYLSKPFEIEEFLNVIRRSLEPPGARQAVRTDPHPATSRLVGSGRAMQGLYKEIGRLAPRPVNVLVLGETGTGKELIARALHEHSSRVSKPFVALNCAALSEALLESELFGHERGAFTGAVERRIGRFEQANEGTLFLDEIGELSPSTQAKLLRVLQEGTFERVGGRHVLQSKARIIAATHVDLTTAMAKGSFREDLYYRLNQATLAVPPLREHSEDIPDITRHFIELHAARMACPPIDLPDPFMVVLQGHSWPGNIRELENVVRQILIRSDGRAPRAEDLADLLKTSPPPAAPGPPALESIIHATLEAAARGEIRDCHAVMVRRVEHALLAQAMDRADGNQSQVARWLGISRVTLREKLRALGLHPGSE